MKCQQNIFFNILLVIAVFSLNACGSSTKEGAGNETDRPTFARKNITDSPSYEPSGIINQTVPTFSWKAIANATTYQFGHESVDNWDQWHSYKITSSDANCYDVGDTCTYTPTDYTFPKGVEKVWWVRAKVNNDWQSWSRAIVFTVVDDDSNTVGIPLQITPSGTVNVLNTELIWQSVSDAIEYKVGYENSETGEGWTVHALSESDANCKYAAICTYKPSSQFPSNNISWWVKAKSSHGVWSDWSPGLSFIIDTSTVDIPDEAYQVLCNAATRPDLGNLQEGIVFNGRRIFVDPNNQSLLKASDPSGANERLIKDFGQVVPILKGISEGIFVGNASTLHGVTSTYRITENESVILIDESIHSERRIHSFVYQNGYDFYMETNRNRPLRDYIRQNPNTGNKLTVAIYRGREGITNTFYFRNQQYYSYRPKNEPEYVGVILNSFILQKIKNCN